MKVCVGGTFDALHLGHKTLLRKAFEVGDKVYIGVTTDEFVKKIGKKAKSYAIRVKRIQKFLDDENLQEKAIIMPLNDFYGNAIEKDYDAIVVSPESYSRAREINDIRKRKGIKEIEIIVAPLILANDGMPISSSRIKNGEIDGTKRIKKMKVCIASKNEVKIEAVKKVFDEIFDFPIEYESIDSKTKKQPFNEEVLSGAIERSKACKNCDYCIGIEAGIVEYDNIYFIEQHVAIRDKLNYVTYGKSPAFQCPKWLLSELKKGKEMKEVIPFKKGEEKKGAIWFFSNKMDRLELTKIGVFMAMIPRLRKNF